MERNPTGIYVQLNGMLWLQGSTTFVVENKNSIAVNVSFLQYGSNGTNTVVTDSFTY